MPDHITRPDTSTLQTACHGIAQSVASSIVEALVEPLRHEIEAKINAMIAEATKDVHSKIAAALAQIQPIQIPINLLAQPVVQPFSSAAPPIAPATVQAAPVVVQEATPTSVQPTQPFAPATAKAAEAVQVAPVPPVAPPAPAAAPQAVGSQDAQDTRDIPLKKDPQRTPKQSGKNFAATIVGLMPGQAHMIKSDFKFAKLAFVPADARNSTQLVALSKSNNPVLFMTDFIRHASVDSVRAAHGNWVYVSGGMSSLREKLRELYAQYQVAHQFG